MLEIYSALSAGPPDGPSDLFAERVVLTLPPHFVVQGHVEGNLIEQLSHSAAKVECTLQHFTERRVGGFEARLPSGELLRVLSRKTAAKIAGDLLLLVPDATSPSAIAAALAGGEGNWLRPAPVRPADGSVKSAAARAQRAVASWRDAFTIREASPAEGGGLSRRGFRRPQVGAIHAAIAHATRSTSPATIVMPTGTGKTETMLALEVAQSIDRLVVIVPNDALRDQIGRKFLTLGVLKEQECLSPDALHPVVLKLAHRPRSAAEVDALFGRVNVVVTTIHVAGQAPADVQERIAR